VRWVRRLVVAGLFVGALVLGWRFAERNADPVFVDYLLGTVDAPRWAVLAGSFGIGVGMTLLVAGFQALRLALTARRWRKVARGLEQEVHQLRNLPLAPASPDAPAAWDPSLEVRGRSG
jgi:uncharacterized integral membrane protein